MMERLDDFFRSEVAYASTKLPKGETGETHRKVSLSFSERDARPFRNIRLIESRRDDNRNIYRGRDGYRANRARDDRAPYPSARGEYNRRVAPVLTLNSLTKYPKEILATKTQLRLPAPRPMINTLRSGNTDRVNSVKDKKRKVREATESWMNVPVSFPAIPSDDVFEEPLIVEAEVKGYLVRRVYVDEWSSVEVMFDHCFENLNPKIKARLIETQTDLVGFAGEVLKPLGEGEVALTEEVLVNPSFPDQLVTIRGGLSDAARDQLKCLLKDNLRVFAWEPSDMTACPKDYYPLPNIDCKVESVMGFKYKCFLDAYKGYHQIQMAEEDEEKTAFYTDQGTYCYTKMPF
ncbi:hypothetical protein Tco_1496105, partial [Tanacetum coccineum]